ncbi:MAG: uroporphyrinogen-III C-methyltransferase [Ferruginibacter sp.]
MIPEKGIYLLRAYFKNAMTKTNQHIGKVILAGAGCGDPELITIKAARYLQQADVVLTDRLVSKEILDIYVSKTAEIIYVGKQCRRGFSTPQKSINELIVQFALEGKLVVRLKGGDASVFSNILDELEALVANNIPYEIIPGVSAAMGAAAYTGIPLTARGYSTAVRLLTFYKSSMGGSPGNEANSAIDWKELAATNDTLVFYMSSETLGEVVSNLVKNDIAADKLLAVVEQATTPSQNVHVTSLYEYEQKLKGKQFASPTLVVIGKVVALHERFAWLKNAAEAGEYFKPAEDFQYESLVRDSIESKTDQYK